MNNNVNVLQELGYGLFHDWRAVYVKGYVLEDDFKMQADHFVIVTEHNKDKVHEEIFKKFDKDSNFIYESGKELNIQNLLKDSLDSLFNGETLKRVDFVIDGIRHDYENVEWLE